MQLSTLTEILFTLLKDRKVTAAELAERYGFSARTAYRYIDVLADTLPLQIKRGRNGRAFLSDSYTLPVEFMRAEEYTAAIDALTSAYAQTGESRFLTARRKLSAQSKTEARHAVLGDCNEVIVFDKRSNKLSATLLTLQASIEAREVVTLRLRSAENTETAAEDRRVEPHALVFDGSAWQLFAFCHTLRAFAAFPLADVAAVFRSNDTFRKRPFKRSDVIKQVGL